MRPESEITIIDGKRYVEMDATKWLESYEKRNNLKGRGWEDYRSPWVTGGQCLQGGLPGLGKKR